MPIQTSHGQPDYRSFSETCFSAVNCNHCFAASYVQRAYIDIAQPRHVGPNYWTATNRLLFLSINPGAGKDSTSDRLMRDDIYEYRAGKLELAEVFLRQHGYMPKWGTNEKFVKYFNSIGCDLQDIALLNVAWCASANNSYPPKMLGECFSKHTQKAIEALRPTTLIACGDKAQKYARDAKLSFVGIPHYAARGKIDFDAVRKTLGLRVPVSANNPPLSAMIVVRARHRSPYKQNDVIRLQAPRNPKSGKSALRYQCYRDGMTVFEYVEVVRKHFGHSEAKKCLDDLKWDLQRNFIRIEPLA